MSSWVYPLIAALVVSPGSAALLVASRRRSESSVRTAVDTFARQANLAVTEDVEPTLMTVFGQQSRRGLAFLAILTPAAAAIFTVAWRMDIAGGGSWVLIWAFYPLLLIAAAVIAGAPRWPTPARTSLAHGRRVRIRDYTDPVTTYAVIVQWTILSAGAVILAVDSSSAHDRLRALGVLGAVVFFLGEYVVLARRRLHQRARAGTVQQLAFGDALTSLTLSKMLGAMPILALPLVFTLSGPGAHVPEPLVNACLLASVGAIVVTFLRKISGPQPLYERLRYPNAPEIPRPPGVLTRLRARRAS